MGGLWNLRGPLLAKVSWKHGGNIFRVSKSADIGTALVVQWLRLPTPNAGGLDSILDLGTVSPAVWCGQKKKP